MSRRYREAAFDRIILINAKIEDLKKKVKDINVEIRKLEIEKEQLMTNIGKDAVDEFTEPGDGS